MDIKSIITFLEVADTKSFSTAAVNLCVTQSAVSKRISMLEDQLSTRLFDRAGKTVRLTEAGRLLIPSARRIATALEQIQAQINSTEGSPGGILRLGVSPHVASEYLPDVLHRFRAAYPDVEISLMVKESSQILNNMADGKLELCLCELNESRKGQFIQHTVEQNAMCVVVSPSHPLAELSNIDARVLTNYLAVLPPKDTVMRMVLSETFANAECRQPDNTLEVHDFPTIKRMVGRGIGWGILPKSMCEACDKLQILDVAQLNLSLNIFFIHRQGRTLSNAAALFAQGIPLQLTI